ncbi:MAG: ABC transporter permease [Chloroflexi bacterium]|nr:ABC transporter permease [Chloroflexota bacterium]
MFRLAFRNLFQSKVRLVISVGGVALALLLILALDAVMTGIERQLTAYIDNSGADIWVSQENVRNMHMAYSALPASVASKVKSVPGVQSVTGILYLTGYFEIGDERDLAYIIGLPKDVEAGGPWRIAEGKAAPGSKEIIIDRGIAKRVGVGLGDQAKVLGEEFTIVGLSEGTAAIAASVAFVSKKDWDRLQANADAVSYVLAKVKPGESPEAIAAQIEQQVPKVTAQTRQMFASQERQVVKDMSTDLITIMNLVGFLIGLAVMALTVYTATLARRAEYGVLKALGARNAHLYRAVLGQAFISVVLGLALGFAFTLLLVIVVPRTGLPIAMEISGESLVKVGGISLVIASLSALLPIKQIAGLDPAMVFRR